MSENKPSLVPAPLDIDALPPLELQREVVTIEGDRNLYRYSVAGSNSPNKTETQGQTVSLKPSTHEVGGNADSSDGDESVESSGR